MNFNVKNKRTQTSFCVTEKEYVLDAALKAGLSLPHSCRGGNCGSCRALLLHGDVEVDDFDNGALSERQQQEGFVLLCRCTARSDLEIDIEEFSDKLSSSRAWPARIDSLKRLCHDVMLMRVILAPGQCFDFTAGQYMDFILPDSKSRSYSIAGFDECHIDFHIRKVDCGLFTTRVFSEYKVGDIVRLYGPLGTFFIREENNEAVIMLAGGSGIAPIKVMLEQFCKRPGTQFTRLYWGVRTQEDIYLKLWLEEFSRKNSWFEYNIILSNADEFYPARKGLVHQAVLEDIKDLGPYQVYASGPPAMIRAAQTEFKDAGLVPEKFYFDSFDYSPDTIARVNAHQTR